MSILNCVGYWAEEPERTYGVRISTGEWDGDENDHDIFFYMDGEPLAVGMTISDDFVITEIES
jgi:hypothetical protein